MALRPWRGCRSARFTAPFALVATPIRHSGFVLCSILCRKLALRVVLRSSASDCSGLCRERRWGHRWRRDHILVFAVRASGRRTFSKGTGGTSDLPESSRSRNHQQGKPVMTVYRYRHLLSQSGTIPAREPFFHNQLNYITKIAIIYIYPPFT